MAMRFSRKVTRVGKLVEYTTENRGVVGSIPTLAISATQMVRSPTGLATSFRRRRSLSRIRKLHRLRLAVTTTHFSKTRSFLKYVAGVIVVGLLIHLAGTYLADAYPAADKVIVQLAALLAVVVLVTLIVQGIVSYLTSGRYAVEALILNQNDELLLYFHPQHKCMLPPGGRVKRSEFPHEAIGARLEERVGLKPDQYQLDGRFHHGLNSGNLGAVQRVAAPFLVQRELHRQRSFIRFHYDFFYVYRLLDVKSHQFDNVKVGPVHFADLDAISEMVAQKRTFPDVLDAYRRVLALSPVVDS